MLRDGRNTIAITLLRAVGELGDWGLFPTPEAQCLGEHTFRMELIPYCADDEANGAFEAYAEAYQFQIPWTVCQTGVHSGQIAPVYTPLRWESAELAFSSMKMNEDTNNLLLRWFNMSGSNTQLIFSTKISVESMYKTTIMEELAPPIARTAVGELNVAVGPCEIVTIGMKPILP
ncbi:alpha-mannosidase [compost metagenome]